MFRSGYIHCICASVDRGKPLCQFKKEVESKHYFVVRLKFPVWSCISSKDAARIFLVNFKCNFE